MTTATLETPAFATGNAIPFGRLLRVELRKMVDTRAGKWLLGVIGLLTAAALVILLLAASTQEHTFANAVGAAATPQGILLPVLGILLITQEWGQRTGMVTFTLEPHRAKVLWAKVAAAVVLGVAAMVLALALAAVVAAIGGAADPWAGMDAGVIGQYFLLEVVGVVGGLVFGLLFLNTAAAIVVSFALPIVFSVVTSLWNAVHKAQPWIDPATAQGPLQSGDHLTSTEWQHLLTTTLIWVVVPFVVGLWRVLRTEVK
ncbi:ABC transporter permease [Nocardioides mangrovicus]|uniref:ABC transporter permease n=1 Tax=Nocardioides mangrovicus TaxID=2478913 RepID=A0A3L8P420_9ACTN|nr:ABC transporter permease [Nocardioides mangrovicus]RLV49777.1 ABC transporter permease [Nocardioides mangrovicus]